jgi:hypothetical protein
MEEPPGQPETDQDEQPVPVEQELAYICRRRTEVHHPATPEHNRDRHIETFHRFRPPFHAGHPLRPARGRFFVPSRVSGEIAATSTGFSSFGIGRVRTVTLK